jgi:hypothetical protein
MTFARQATGGHIGSMRTKRDSITQSLVSQLNGFKNSFIFRGQADHVWVDS